jgi:ABC-type glycerol-3-phosphate transport system substrate-binding protein
LVDRHGGKTYKGIWATSIAGNYMKNLFESRRALTKMKAIIITAIIIVACIAAVAAYFVTLPSTTSEKTTVTLCTWGDWMLTGLVKNGVKQPLLVEFENETGITVNFVFAAEDAIRTKIWLDVTSHTGAYDILGMDNYAVAQLAVGDFVEPLEPYIQNKPYAKYFQGFNDFYTSTLDANTYEGKLYALPTYTFGAGYTYRADLFAKYNVTVPTTFAELEAACAKLAAGFAADGLDIAPITMRGLKGEEPTIETTGITWAYGASWFNGNARTVNEINSTKAMPMFNSTEFVAGYEEYGKLGRNWGPAGMSDYSWYECAVDLAEGRTASFLGFSAMYWFVKSTTQLPLTNFKIALAPMGPVRRMDTFWTFSYFLNKDSQNKDAAWKVLQLIASKQGMTEMAKTNLINTLPLKSLMEGQDIKTWTKTPDDDMATIIESFNVSSIEYAPMIPEYKDLCYMLGTAASQILAGENTAQGALSLVEELAIKLMKDAGYYK